jgi:hypothetical protein
MDQVVIKCLKLNYCKILMQSLLANMEASSLATRLAKSTPALDAITWLAEAANKYHHKWYRDVIKSMIFNQVN